MDETLLFLNLDGLDDGQVSQLRTLLHPSNLSANIEFPWSEYNNEKIISKGTSSLNVHAPVFEVLIPPPHKGFEMSTPHHVTPVPFMQSSPQISVLSITNNGPHYQTMPEVNIAAPIYPAFSNGTHITPENVFSKCHPFPQHHLKAFNGELSSPVQTLSAFKLNPTVSCFVPKGTFSDGYNNEMLYRNRLKELSKEEHQNVTCHDPVASESSESVDIDGEFEMYDKHSSHLESEEVYNAKDANEADIEEVSTIKEESVVKEESVLTVSIIKEEPVKAASVVKEEFVIKAIPVMKEESVKPVPVIKEESVVKAVSVTKEDHVKVVSAIKEESIKAVSSMKEESVKAAADAVANLSAPPVIGRRSWADIVSSGQKPASKSPVVMKSMVENDKGKKVEEKEDEGDTLSVEEDKMALTLGRHFHEQHLDFESILLQPRGLINRRNWCYINATLQALLACSPFYSYVRNLPLGPAVDRGKSSTPVIDSMVRLTYEFKRQEAAKEELQLGIPFQPDFIYEMLKDLKSDCLKGHQEDAEEFLSFILNGMHEEMVKIMKNYEKKNNLNINQEAKENGDISDCDDEWQVIGSKHKGMVTRKVAEYRTPISDLLGGQIKSSLTAGGNKTSASIQPFFTLQLDIQSDTVTTVAEALKEMTVKEPIQGYTCAKTKQEVEAYSHLSLQKLPPILVLHLKRFVYNKTGGCKKVMKKTDYPLQLELSKDIFSPDVKKIHRQRTYKLFAVMYHDGEEAIKGHYISDVYNHGCQTWIRCDDRTISNVSEDQVLSHSPPRVPYLLFYQEC